MLSEMVTLSQNIEEEPHQPAEQRPKKTKRFFSECLNDEFFTMFDHDHFQQVLKDQIAVWEQTAASSRQEAKAVLESCVEHVKARREVLEWKEKQSLERQREKRKQLSEAEACKCVIM